MNIGNRGKEPERRKGASLLDEVLERRLLSYSLAAGAALAGASAAQAKVVFTPSDTVLTVPCHYSTNTLQIDLNNDGVTDFTLNNFCETTSHGGYSTCSCGTEGLRISLYARGAQRSNLIAFRHREQQAALRNGAAIGSGNRFSASGSMSYNGYIRGVLGSFVNTTGRALGVRFLIDGEIHYGWIGFRSTDLGVAKLAGWAYETEPNTPIIVGDRGAANSASGGFQIEEPTSLQLLAMGHTAVADRQRRLAFCQEISLTPVV